MHVLSRANDELPFSVLALQIISPIGWLSLWSRYALGAFFSTPVAVRIAYFTKEKPMEGS